VSAARPEQSAIAETRLLRLREDEEAVTLGSLPRDDVGEHGQLAGLLQRG
jgi:hypothetical protein